MLSTWGGNNGIDTISQVELDCLGFDTCAKYCKEYCWHYGMGYCGNCAYDKERTKRRDAESNDDVFDQINEEIDNLDTYTIYMGSAQLDKVCVEFKDVKKIIAKYINRK